MKNIETMFNLGDKIWSLIDFKAAQVPITRIEIIIENNLSDELEIITRYFVNKGTAEDYKCEIIAEYRCFSTREELLESL